MPYKKICGIYKITSPSGRVYIGQSRNIKHRKAQYKKLKCKNQPKIYRSLSKYGWENHTFEIIEECEGKNLNKRERYWQDYYNVLEEGLNCILTATDKKETVYTKELINKISESKKGDKNPMYKKDWREGRTEEDIKNWRDKISKAKTGKKAHPNVIKMLKSRIGDKNPNFGKRGKDAPAYGVKHSEERKQKMREFFLSDKNSTRGKKKDRKLVEHTAEAKSRKIINVKTFEVTTIRKACKILNLKHNTMFSKMSEVSYNDTDYMFKDEYDKGIGKNDKHFIYWQKKKKDIFINKDTGIFHNSIAEIADCYNISYNKLKILLREEGKNSHPFEKVLK